MNHDAILFIKGRSCPRMCCSEYCAAHISSHSFHCIFIVMRVKKYGEVNKFSAFCFHGNGGHHGFDGTHEGTSYNC